MSEDFIMYDKNMMEVEDSEIPKIKETYVGVIK